MSIKEKISKLFRPYRNKKRQKYFLKKYGEVNGNYIILSNNCIGGMCYHDANKEFLSPTINLYVDDFLTFASNVKEYVSCDIKEVENSGFEYPVAVLEPKGLPPINVYFVHYNSFLEGKEKWIERSKRMLSQDGKLCIIYSIPKSKVIDDNIRDNFLKINAYRKLCFYRETKVELPQNTESTSFVMIPKQYQNMDYSKYIGLLSRKRYFDKFFNIFYFLFK